MKTPERAPLRFEQIRLLRVIGRMPLATAEQLAPLFNTNGQLLRRRLLTLKQRGYLEVLHYGMTERRQDRWFLTTLAVTTLYTTDHVHAQMRDIMRAGGTEPFAIKVASMPDAARDFAYDHEHLPHVEHPLITPFGPDLVTGGSAPLPDKHFHEHPPWTATARGVRVCLRRLPMIESLYSLAPGLLREREFLWPQDASGADASDSDFEMTDFWLMRGGGFFHATARYGRDFWLTFTYAGLHATERALRRKHAHRHWGIDCYVAEKDHYFRISNRIFYEDPDQRVRASLHVVIAADAWQAHLASRTLADTGPLLVCTPDGASNSRAELTRSHDRIADPVQRMILGSPERVSSWRGVRGEDDALQGPNAYQVFATIAQFPAMRSRSLAEFLGMSLRVVNKVIAEMVAARIVETHESRHYLAEYGMRRAATLSRVLTRSIRSRHAAYWQPQVRSREARHDDGVNRLVLKFAEERVDCFSGWRSEINVPDITQIRPDLVIQVASGPFGAGVYCVEYERVSSTPSEVMKKLRPYRRCAAICQPVPMLMVCGNERAEDNFISLGAGLPLVVTHIEAAIEGRITGDETVWRGTDGEFVPLHCVPALTQRS